MRRLCVASLCCLLLACGDANDTGSMQGSTGADVQDTSTGGASASEATTAPDPTGDPEATTASRDTDTDTDTGSAETGDPTAGESTTSGAESSGGDESTGPGLPRGQWAMTEITYTEGGMSETLTMQDRAFCDATLEGGVLLLRYQQQGGFTVWALYMPDGIGVGSHALTQDFSGVYMNINEVSNAWQAYFDPAMAFGTLELTDADLQPGGTVAGTLTATLTSNDGSTTAAFESTFYAEL